MSDTVVKTLKDVAKACDAHDKTVRGWVKKGMPRKQIRTTGRDKYRYDIKKIEEWRATRLSGNQGAEVISMSDKELEAIKHNIAKFKGAIDFYKINRADIFAGKQISYQKLADQILATIDIEEIKNEKIGNKLAALKVLDTGAAIFYDKERLERGESTQNVSVLVGAIKDLKRREKSEPAIPEGS